MNPELLRAVIDHPADDAVRLVMADWLEEHGELERSEFIRVQVELAKRPKHWHAWGDDEAVEKHGCRVCDLGRREKELLNAANALAWGPVEMASQCRGAYIFALPSDGPVSPPSTSILATFRRGFVAAVACTCADWLGHGPALVRQQPIERVALSDGRPYRNTNGQFVWMDGDFYRASAAHEVLPGGIFALLAGGELSTLRSARYYDTKAAALDDLSRACLLWAKGVCPECGGDGFDPDNKFTSADGSVSCPACDGSGRVESVRQRSQ